MGLFRRKRSSNNNEDKRYPAPIANGPVVPVKGMEGVFVVEGSFIIGGPLQISRTMTIIVVRIPILPANHSTPYPGHEIVTGPDKGLTLFNTVRLDEKGEAQLLELGPIKRVVRLSSMHGMDDPYYVHKFGTEVWGMPGMTWDEYCKKCDPVTMTHNLLEASLFPEEAEVVTLENITVPECMLFFRGKGLLLACDFIMQCENPRHEKISDVNFGRLSHFVGRLIGFKGEAVTPSVYVKNFTKDKNFACIKATSDKIQELPYTTIISGHGPPMIGDAKARRQGFIDACK